MNTSSLAGKVIRAPSLKRGKNGEASLGEKVKLERVLGLTVSSNAALDCDPDTELVVYPAGCTVVLFNPIKNRQSHLLNSSRKTITCLALSPDGHYLVTGECGHLPLVRVWDLHEEGSPGVQVAELPSHKYGINCVIKEAVPLMGRSAILGEQRNNYFCDVACGHGKTGDSTHMAVHPMNAKYPDAIALAYDPQNCKLTCIYNDHSMYIWDVRDIKRVVPKYGMAKTIDTAGTLLSASTILPNSAGTSLLGPSKGHNYDKRRKWTTSDIQSGNILALKEISLSNMSRIQVKAEPHRFLDAYKGVVICYDLDCITIEEI
uniref:Mitogen-activated protein kinase-binding protein 1 n=1 Tax=Timema shepardi TaxID=629360 RepID=A0A7R9G178_TIMSH|nr:unnamed protein product [Timema shepardi]